MDKSNLKMTPALSGNEKSGMTDKNKPRVLMLGNFLSGYGATKTVCEDMADRLESREYGVLRSSARRGRYARLIDRAYTAIRNKNNYDVGYSDVFSGPAFVWAEAACWAMRRVHRPYILTLHGGNLPNFAKRWPTRVRGLLSSAIFVTTPSKYLFENMRLYRDDLILLPNAIDISNYEFKPRSRISPRLVWLRAFSEMYNPGMSMQVVKILRKDIPDVHLVMYGPDHGSLENCRKIAADLEVEDCVEFPGTVPKSQVPASLQQNDIFINTTNIDNTPISVIEAMACGLCVVSTNVGGIPYLLDDGHDSLLVRPNDPEAMAGEIKRLLSEPGLAGMISHNGRVKVEQFDWNVVMPVWEELFGKIA